MTAKIYLFTNQVIEVHTMVDYWTEKGYQIRYTGRRLRLIPVKKPAIVALPGPRTNSKRSDK